MKITSILSISFLFIVFNTQAQKKVLSIEKQIDSIFLETQAERVSKLNELLSNIPNLRNDAHSSITDYWIAYTHYKIGLCYLSDNKEKSIENFTDAINLLEKIKPTTSEILALEGTIISTQISVQSDKAWALSQKANQKFEQSVKLDDTNPRAHLGMGKSDFYKPSEYGGGKMVDTHLKKALQLYKENEKTNDNEPSWGKEEGYYFLSAFYLRENSLRDAKFYNSLGLKKFPKNELLLAQKERLNKI